LLRFICSRVRNYEDAQDLTQDVIAAALKNLAQLETPRLFRSWLRGIARNVLLDWVKNLGHVHISLSEEREANLQAVGDGPPALLELWEDVDALPEEQREVIRLKYAGRCTYAEMAAVLGIAESTVSKRLCEAREQLRRRWRGYGSWEGQLFDPDAPASSATTQEP
jgi:RNA polymerase sigma-70 factor, ECF subfamily